MILALTLLACQPDDVTDESKDTSADADTDTDTDTDTDATGPGDIQDTWVSEGSDISPLFQGAPFSYASINAMFAADLSYTVAATDADGTVYDLAGTYVLDATTSPGSITLNQTAPAVLTAQGIWQVDGDTLTYEVVQTDPNPYGFVAPTPATGFGSTSGPGVAANSNIQIYQRL